VARSPRSRLARLITSLLLLWGGLVASVTLSTSGTTQWIPYAFGTIGSALGLAVTFIAFRSLDALPAQDHSLGWTASGSPILGDRSSGFSIGLGRRS